MKPFRATLGIFIIFYSFLVGVILFVPIMITLAMEDCNKKEYPCLNKMLGWIGEPLIKGLTFFDVDIFNPYKMFYEKNTN